MQQEAFLLVPPSWRKPVLVFVHLPRDSLCTYKEICICILSLRFKIFTPMVAYSKPISAFTFFTSALALCMLSVHTKSFLVPFYGCSIPWCSPTMTDLRFPLGYSKLLLL